MDDGALVLLALLAVVAFLLGPIGFFLALGARSRIGAAVELSRKFEDLEERLLQLEQRVARGVPAPEMSPAARSAAPASPRAR